MFLAETTVDPLAHSVTIASACNKVFRKNFLKPNTIGIVPEGGYRRKERQSVMALKWLKWLSEQNNWDIQHARNRGEKRIGPYKVDGCCGNKVFEFHR